GNYPYLQGMAHSFESALHLATTEVSAVIRQARHLAAIHRTVLDALPEQAAAHVHVAGMDSQRLILHVDSAAWATRLRSAEPQIRRKLAQQMRLHAETTQVRVRPGLAPGKPRRVKRHISASNRTHIGSIARHVDDA